MNINKIACCTDFSENSERAFRTAFEMAEEFGAKLSIMHILSPAAVPLFINQTYWALPPFPKDSLLKDLEVRIEEQYGEIIGNSVDYEIVVLNGHTSSEILNFLTEKKVDMVVLGSYGHTFMGVAIFGSIIKKITKKAPCPVMIVRGRGGKGRRKFKQRRQSYAPINLVSERRFDGGRRREEDRRAVAAVGA